jgi:hypothetical protein
MIFIWLFSIYGTCYGAQVKERGTTIFFLVSTLVSLAGIYLALWRIKR